MPRFLISLLMLLSLSACEQGFYQDQARTAGTAAKSKKVRGFLPAFRDPAEALSPKADSYADTKVLHPEWFAITKPPAAGTFRAFKEWEPMQALLMTCSDYLPDDQSVFTTFSQLAFEASKAGQVWIIVNSSAAKSALVSKLRSLGMSDAELNSKLRYFSLPNDAIWTIDYAPLPIINTKNQLGFMDFVYYPERVLDDAIPTRLGNLLGTTTYRAPISLEGGNFQADGKGRCYTTQRELYYTGLSRDELAQIFLEYFGCVNTVILKDITNDGTGHVDMFFKLAQEDVAVLGEYTVVNDSENKKRMDDNEVILKAIPLSGGRVMAVFRLPMPYPGSDMGDVIPRTYINSTLYVSADGKTKLNLWPMYSVDKGLEAEAAAVWKAAMPDFEHIGIESDQVSLYSGALHCISRNIPAPAPAKWVEDGVCVGNLCDGPAGGYSGSCVPTSYDDPGCWGPEWLCSCNDCLQCPVPKNCGNGTCGSDESCLSCPDDCPCGNGTVCVAGQCIQDSCGNGACEGKENCFNCAKDCKCGASMTCVLGSCVEDPCLGISYDGCCDGSFEVYCEDEVLKVGDCGAEGCGWVSGDKWYTCGGYGSAPDNDPPKDCRDAYDYPPGCNGKECGDNGVGMSCGKCSNTQDCVNFKCVAKCVPDCTGKECGSDGCTGTCGDCPFGRACDEGACEKCYDECEEAAVGCSSDLISWLCQDVNGCLTKVETGCPNGQTCEAGVCTGDIIEIDTSVEPDVDVEKDVVDPGKDTTDAVQTDTAGVDTSDAEPDATTVEPGKKGGGSSCSTSTASGSATVPLPALLLLLPLLGLAARRRQGAAR